MRKKLDESIEKNENYAKIYSISLEIDDLIAEYYREEKRRNKTI